jgi:hypothetical protein
MLHGFKINNLKKYPWLQNRQLKTKSVRLDDQRFWLLLESTSIKLNFIKSEPANYGICGGELRSLKINEFNRYICWLVSIHSKIKCSY